MSPAYRRIFPEVKWRHLERVRSHAGMPARVGVPRRICVLAGMVHRKSLAIDRVQRGTVRGRLTLPRETIQLAREGISIYPMLHLLRHCLTMGFLLLVLAAYVSRTRPMAPACGFWEKVFPLLLAFAGPIGLLVLERFAMPHSWGALSPGLPLALLGSGVSVWALWHLRASFAIMTEARGPVTSGPYRFVRHPLYLGEAFTMLGLCLINGTIGAVLFFGRCSPDCN